MKTLIAIGDIHGEKSSLTSLINLLEEENLIPPDALVISLGDAINKGSDSRGVLDALIGLGQRCSVQLIQGNHEAALLECLRRGNVGRLLQMGGAATLRSYGVTPTGGPLTEQLSKCLPPSHMRLLCTSPTSITHDQILLTHKFADIHAGLNIHGHAYQSSKPTLSSENSINLDTGCGSGGPLTALHYPSGRFFQAKGDRASELEEVARRAEFRMVREFFGSHGTKNRG